ncbi:uncharacterized protein [Clytia hemisphaerica]|uniref:uncharacterized protein n=1 Tax=Clytia hemisphaerica TaxID=252671 RepID=UPI0034D4ECAA
MATNTNDWLYDNKLESDLNTYVNQKLKRTEILDFVKRDFPQYPWSLRTLDRRLRAFGIRYIDSDVSIDDVREVVGLELAGPGRQLGYRAMQLKIRQNYDMKVSRDQVHDVMYEANPQLLRDRRPAFKKKKKKIPFATKGPNWVLSVDGHDKLMGYQNWTFPVAIYGCIDTASRKILWLNVWVTNSKPELIGRWYLDYLFEYRILPCYLRADKGTETGTMATIHSFLREKQNDLEEPGDSIIYGPSTSNQIERWWREHHERLEKYFKDGLVWLKEENHYDPSNSKHRNILAFIMIPLIQNQLDEFKDVIWNPHRIRFQKDTLMADGIPNHIYDFPENYDLERCGFDVQLEDLQEAARLSGVLDVPNDFLSQNDRRLCETILSDPEKVTPEDFVQSYLNLRYSINFEQMEDNTYDSNNE